MFSATIEDALKSLKDDLPALPPGEKVCAAIDYCLLVLEDEYSRKAQQLSEALVPGGHEPRGDPQMYLENAKHYLDEMAYLYGMYDDKRSILCCFGMRLSGDPSDTEWLELLRRMEADSYASIHGRAHTRSRQIDLEHRRLKESFSKITAKDLQRSRCYGSDPV